MLNQLLKLLPTQIAYAHCDIPCGIYDPKPAQIAAATVLKMTEKILALPTDGSPEEILQARNNFVRMVSVKEEHAERCEQEVLILWTDFFKPEHLKKWPDLSEKILNISKLCSKAKQGVDQSSAQELVQAVDELAHIFNLAQAK
ncbi:MAG TPA: superoxide dismutase, Ni [Patescibacteria group bacterium]|nr:superoxide dismutase, Ni [Patescibacteria group bacterium]